MEGRTIVRPNAVHRRRRYRHHPPSMEGRTIVRQPEQVTLLQWRAGQLSGRTSRSPLGPFNGGPDNCPAEQVLALDESFASRSLQWRAGQLSPHHLHDRQPFNGGPDNCPAEPLLSFGVSDLRVFWRLRAVLEVRGFEGILLLLSSCTLPCVTRHRAVPGARALTLALASDDRRSNGGQRCSSAHEFKALSPTVRRWTEVDEGYCVLSMVNDA